MAAITHFFGGQFFGSEFFSSTAPDPASTGAGSSGSAGKKKKKKVLVNGKLYEVLLQRAAVRDFCHFRISFTAPKEWTKITLDLSKAAQPNWGKQMPWEGVDVRNLVFTIVMGTANDEDYDLAIDDVRLMP